MAGPSQEPRRPLPILREASGSDYHEPPWVSKEEFKDFREREFDRTVIELRLWMSKLEHWIGGVDKKMWGLLAAACVGVGLEFVKLVAGR